MGIDYVEPKSGLERTIAAVIGEVLGVPRVGIEDNFFDLGVHSLLMVRAANGLSERLGRKVQVLEMFRFPTVASLAQHLSQEEDEAPSKEQFEQRAEARRQGMRRRDRRGRAAVVAGEVEDAEESQD
jgi:acyl carrier protein